MPWDPKTISTFLYKNEFVKINDKKLRNKYRLKGKIPRTNIESDIYCCLCNNIKIHNRETAKPCGDCVKAHDSTKGSYG